MSRKKTSGKKKMPRNKVSRKKTSPKKCDNQPAINPPHLNGSTPPENRPHLPYRTANRSNTKRVGERSEAAFLEKAYNFGFGVARPWGDSERYDFILDNGLQLLRIQVKGTDSLRAGAYETRATYTIGKRRAVYTKRDIDFFVGHVIPLDIWYIMPVEIVTPQPMLRFYPHRKAKKMRLEPYKEHWRLLEAQEPSPRTITIQAAADETIYAPEDSCRADTPVRQPDDPWQRPVPWAIPKLEILFQRRLVETGKR